MIGIKLSPWELSINVAGIEINNGIISLMIPTKIKRILLNFPMKNRKISSKKKNLKKQYSIRYKRPMKNLIEYHEGSRDTSQIIEIRLFGPGPRST